MLVLPLDVSKADSDFALPRSGNRYPLGPPCRSQETSYAVLDPHREEKASRERQRLPIIVFTPFSGSWIRAAIAGNHGTHKDLCSESLGPT